MMNTNKLLDKANKILNSIEDLERPEIVKIKTIMRFLNSSTLLQLNSKEAMKWLREPDIENTFLKKLTKDSYIMDRPHNILLQGVPITFDLSSKAHLREIEEVNSLRTYLIIKAWWIKPENRRH